MVLGAVTQEPIRAVGDVFVISMQSRKWGLYEIDNYVVEYEPDRLIGWEPQAGRGHPNAGKPRLGHRWSYRLSPDGDGATVVTETYDCSRAPADERAAMDNGQMWAGAMADTLARLEAVCLAAAQHDKSG